MNMKRIIILLSVIGTLILASCGTRQHCDAYGSVEYKTDSTEIKS